MKRLLVGLVVLASLVAMPSSAVTRGIATQSTVNWCVLDWVNTDVTALPTTSGNILVCTLPARARVMNAFVRVIGAAVGPTTVTVSLGRTSSTFIDYVVASNAKASGVYGDVSGERGTNMADAFFGDVPSLAATTDVNLQFVSTGASLPSVTASTGQVRIRWELVP
jgi:hypothetical protein